MTPTPTPDAERIVKDVAIERCQWRGCEDEEAGSHGETCRQCYGADIEKYCDPCVMSALLAELDAKDAQLADLRAIVDVRRRGMDIQHSTILPMRLVTQTITGARAWMEAVGTDRATAVARGHVSRLLAALIAPTPEDGR